MFSNDESLKPDWSALGDRLKQKHAQVLPVAARLFAQQGFQNTEVQQIADATGISKATIYKIFKNKNNLLLTLIDHTLEQFRNIVLANLVSVAPPVERFQKIAFELLSYVESNPDVCLVVVRDAGDFFPAMGEAYNRSLEATLPFLEPVFAEARQQGELRAMDTWETVDLVMSYVIGHVYRWLITGRHGSLAESGVKGIEVLIEGLK